VGIFFHFYSNFGASKAIATLVVDKSQNAIIAISRKTEGIFSHNEPYLCHLKFDELSTFKVPNGFGSSTGAKGARTAKVLVLDAAPNLGINQSAN
jgi:hypothetical protein